MALGGFSFTVNGEHHMLLAASCQDEGNVGVADMLASSFYCLCGPLKKILSFLCRRAFGFSVKHGFK